MFSAVSAALRSSVSIYRCQLRTRSINATRLISVSPTTVTSSRQFSLTPTNGFSVIPKSTTPSLLFKEFLKPLPCSTTQERTVTKFSLNKGKRKSVKAVIKRFKRLDWGCWIRTHSGRHKKLWKKSIALKKRLRQHVLTNGQQSWLLDSMVTNFWRKPKYYIDDPYEPYHKREEFWSTRRKPVE